MELVHREAASLGRHGGCAPSSLLAEQFARDVALSAGAGDRSGDEPFFNRNLSLKQAYRLSFPPRTRATETQVPEESHSLG